MIKYRRIKILMSVLLVIASLFTWLYWGNQSIQTTIYEVNHPNIKESLYGFTIVQVSDLHNKEFGNNQKDLIVKIKSIKPNIIAVTGDLIDSKQVDVNVAMEFIEKAVKIAPVYYVTGNHEAWSDEYENLNQRLALAGVHMMDGKVEELTYNGEKICLLGIADPAFSDGSAYASNAEKVDSKIKELSYNKDLYSVLLSHHPELFDVYVENKVNLVLTGHAHGGQFRIPFVGGIIAPNQGLFPKYTSGIFKDGDTKMIISKGLGNSIIPIRINNRPELVVVKLYPES